MTAKKKSFFISHDFSENRRQTNEKGKRRGKGKKIAKKKKI
jgi:hypothetical protein